MRRVFRRRVFKRRFGGRSRRFGRKRFGRRFKRRVGGFRRNLFRKGGRRTLGRRGSAALTTGNRIPYSDSTKYTFKFTNQFALGQHFENAGSLPIVRQFETVQGTRQWQQILGTKHIKFLSDSLGNTNPQYRTMLRLNWFQVKITMIINSVPLYFLGADNPNKGMAAAGSVVPQTYPAYWAPNFEVDKYLTANREEDPFETTKWVRAHPNSAGQYIYTTKWVNRMRGDTAFNPTYSVVQIPPTPIAGESNVPGGRMGPWTPQLYMARLLQFESQMSSLSSNNPTFVWSPEGIMAAEGQCISNLLRMPAMRFTQPNTGVDDGGANHTDVTCLFEIDGSATAYGINSGLA